MIFRGRHKRKVFPFVPASLKMCIRDSLFIQSGIPVIYSGDEIGQVNDYSYKESEDYDRRSDSRYIHRGHFRWDLEPAKDKKGTVQNRIFASMKKMEELKFKYRPFDGEADVWTEETYDTALLCVCRKSGNEMVTGIFNLSLIHILPVPSGLWLWRKARQIP